MTDSYFLAMFTSIFNFCWFHLWIKFKLLKFCFILVTSYFLYQELVLFLATKPTLISISKSRIQPRHFPAILVCPTSGEGPLNSPLYVMDESINIDPTNLYHSFCISLVESNYPSFRY